MEVFLWEDDLAAAWEHAQAGGCSTALWRRLALARGADRPDDALTVYRLLMLAAPCRLLAICLLAAVCT